MINVSPYTTLHHQLVVTGGGQLVPPARQPRGVGVFPAARCATGGSPCGGAARVAPAAAAGAAAEPRDVSAGRGGQGHGR